jgi:DNA-directed RNA polymerase specialized sigma24 family protein
MIRVVANELIEDGSERATEALPIDLDALFRAEGDGVYRTLYAFTGGRADIAEDATAEAFARAVATRDTLKDPLAWIYRVAFRVAIDELRRDRRRAAAVEVSSPPPELVGVTEALRQLAPNQRAAIVLRHVMDLDIAEIADRMGIAKPTVRVHLHRGRARLRELLGTEEVD